MKLILRQIKKLRRNDRGVALLFTLGMLALLLIMALAFAHTSMIESKAAAAGNNGAVARMLAQSTIQRVIGAMSMYDAKYYTGFISHDTSNVQSSACDQLTHLETVTADGVVIFALPSNYDWTDSGSVQWQYVKDGGVNSPSRIIGRYAYKVISGGGKLCPSASVDSGAYTTALNENGGTELRLGAEVDEINLQALDPTGSNLTTTMVSAMSSDNASPAGTLPAGDTWADYETLFDSAGVSAAAAKNLFREWFVLSPPKDPEAFWLDSNGDGNKEESEYYHRFNLARSDWSSVTVANMIDVDKAFSGTDTACGLRWLKQWGDAGSWSTAAVRSQQIAANIIDYCDSDSIATTDDTNNPTYTGNELAPYINELGVDLEMTVTASSVDSNTDGTRDTAKVVYDFELRLGAEAINIYGENFTGTAVITIVDGAVYYSWTDAQGGNATDETESLNGKTVSLTLNTNAYGHSWVVANSWTKSSSIGSLSETDADNANGKVTSVKVRISKAKLEYAGDFSDFSAPDGSSEYSVVVANPASASVGSPGSADAYFCYEVEDPRQNLLNSDWAQANGSTTSYAAVNGTPGSKNTIADPSAGSDPELATDPGYLGSAENQHISTAYIRNAPMTSPWEIGLIHRASKWETLNIKKYNDTDQGGKVYADGDANILDQIKMTSATDIAGKVNVNSTNADVVRALFQNIQYGCPLSTPAASGTKLDQSGGVNGFADTLGTSLTAANGTTTFQRRAEILSSTLSAASLITNLTNSGLYTQNTDASREEIIGKFVNLCKAAPVDEIKILAIAQTIKDVGGGTVLKDFNGDGDSDDTDVLNSGSAAAKLALGFMRNSGTTFASSYPTVDESITTTFGTYDLGADEITGEQKILVSLWYDSVKLKWRILRYEFIDD